MVLRTAVPGHADCDSKGPHLACYCLSLFLAVLLGVTFFCRLLETGMKKEEKKRIMDKEKGKTQRTSAAQHARGRSDTNCKNH